MRRSILSVNVGLATTVTSLVALTACSAAPPTASEAEKNSQVGGGGSIAPGGVGGLSGLPGAGGTPGGGDGDLAVGDGDLSDGTGDGDSTPMGTPTNVAGAFLGEVPSGCTTLLPLVFRDFHGNGEAGAHTDFELSELFPAGGPWEGSNEYGDPKGSQAYMGVNEAGCEIVAPTLGADLKPVFKHGRGYMRTLSPETRTPGVIQSVASCAANYEWQWAWTPPNSVASAASFGSWYNNVEGTNMEVAGYLELTNGVFESNAFFPLDGVGFGNTQGQAHNYHFTTEAHVNFVYEQGASFEFQGDDDLWIFVNGKLAIDLGSIHEPMKGTINFDRRATELGIVVGETYPMDIFHAERQTLESNFKIETNIECFEPVNVVR